MLNPPAHRTDPRNMAFDDIRSRALPRNFQRVATALVAAILLAGTWGGAAPAGAQQSFTFQGGGWGHGVGMSQYGACGMATAGRSYTQILTHYYSGTKVGSIAEPANLRVLLAEADSFVLTVPAGSTISGVGTIASAATITVKRSGGNAVLSGGVSRTVALPLTVAQQGAMKITPPGHRFDRGHLVIRASESPSKKLRAIVEGLSTRDYLLGLGEMSASWPAEALKAQATAARTIATYKATHSGGADHDLKGYADGAYIGYEMRHGAGSHWSDWVAAIDQTAGKVITYGGAVISSAVYSSSSGGRTANNEIVWGGGNPRSAVAYLRGVDDPDDNGCRNSRNSWSLTFTASQLGAKLGTAAVRSIAISGTIGASGRTDSATITFTDTSGVKRSFTGAQLRWKLGLYSTKFTISGATRPKPPAPKPASNRPPSGTLVDIRAHQGRNILVAGHASDPDGTPRMFVADVVNGRTSWYVFNSARGKFLAAFPAAPGKHTTCVAVLDTPTGTGTVLGCHNTVIK